MRITITGATGLIGSRLVPELLARGDEVTVLSRDPAKAGRRLGEGVETHAWDPRTEPAPAAALAGRDAVVHLAGENIAQRWNDDTRRRIRESREQGTRRLVEGLASVDTPARPKALVSMSAIGYYGDRGDELVDEDTPPGDDFLADVCIVWEAEADAATELGLRVVRTRNGVVLDKRDGALATMLTPFKLGVGGPVAGGRQYLPWVHLDDAAGLIVKALDDETWNGAYNLVAPDPVTNADFSKALGRALHRPALVPVPAFAVRALYGGMAQLVTEGQRAVPRRALEQGFEHRHPNLDEALTDALR